MRWLRLTSYHLFANWQYMACRLMESRPVTTSVAVGLMGKIFSERELMFMFAICRRASICRLSVTFVHPTQRIEIFGNVSAPFNTLVI